VPETETEKKGPIEVWLSQSNLEVKCMVVREDESIYEIPVDALTVRGAEREITGWLISQGYEPAGRWDIAGRNEDTGDEYEVSRKFRPAKK
jgi:hypothetical protein